jgi:hypothetical protein
MAREFKPGEVMWTDAHSHIDEYVSLRIADVFAKKKF